MHGFIGENQPKFQRGLNLNIGLQRYTEISVYLPNTGFLITDRIPTDFPTFYRIPTSSKYLVSVSNIGRCSLTGRYYRWSVSKIGDGRNVLSSESLLLPTSGSIGKVEIPLKMPIRNTDRGAKTVYRNFGII